MRRRTDEPCLQAQAQSLAESLPRIGQPDFRDRRPHGFGAFYGPRGILELAGGGVADAKILPRSSDEAGCRKLWEISERLTSVTYPA